jgi:hypothetical protein
MLVTKGVTLLGAGRISSNPRIFLAAATHEKTEFVVARAGRSQQKFEAISDTLFL